MFWLASRFSKIKKPNSHFLENQRGIAGVCIFDTTPASMRATKVSLIIITMSLPDEQSSYMEPSSPIGRMQSGLAALFVTPSPKKRMEKLTDLSVMNPTSTRGSR
jgi:hypothetical protein